MLIDTHCHLDAPEFDADRPQVIERARHAEVGLMVIPAVSPATFATSRDAAVACEGAYALGIHPLYTPQAVEDDHFIDAVGAIDDRELGVKTQVHKHGLIVGNLLPL